MAGDAWAAVQDTRHLLWFRTTAVRRRGAGKLLGLLFVAITLAVAVVPAWTSGAATSDRAFDLLLLLPTALAGFLALAIISAAASGGGREVLARDPAQIHPISPTTDHLGALVLAPLNIAWLLQAWTLLGTTAYAWGFQNGALGLLRAQLTVLLWIAAATAVAQVVAWSLEGVRRLARGILVVRSLTVALLAGVLVLQLGGHLTWVLDRVPTRRVVISMVSDSWLTWGWGSFLLLLLLAGAVVIGALPAHLAARLPVRDETAADGGSHPARRLPGSDLGGLVRTDRGSVWRAVPMRRGVAVLAVGPGLVALLGNLPWSSLTILPGLVASGGALLYGVNAWCLDARGALWRESLPVAPSKVFAARALVLAEFLLVASLATVALGAVRAGVPSPTELIALLCTLVVVTVQVVAAAMRWSGQRPYAVDLRSARATPAPPIMMVAYSSRLALSTTVTGLVFSALAKAPTPGLSVILAVPFLCWSGWRLLRAGRVYVDPVQRARILTTVAA